MIDFEYNDGDLEVRDRTLDGNINHLDLGGARSNPRFQLAATGILLVNNRSVLIENVTCRRHGLDGASINWKNDPETSRDQWDPQT